MSVGMLPIQKGPWMRPNIPASLSPPKEGVLLQLPHLKLPPQNENISCSNRMLPLDGTGSVYSTNSLFLSTLMSSV